MSDTAPVIGRPTSPLPPDQAQALRELAGAPLPSAPAITTSVVATPDGASAATAVKPGWQTTEFWLGLAATLLSALYASGVIPTSGAAATIAGIAATVLIALGYKVSRTLIKRAAALVLIVAIGGAAQTACISRAQVSSGAGAGLNCEAPNVKALVADLIPFAIAELQKWISGSGSVDTAGLKADLAAIKTDVPKCALDAAVAILTTPAPANPSAPLSAPMPVGNLRAAYAQVRGELGWPR